MREFKDIYFDGAGEESRKRASRLHELLDEGLTLLSGMQQPPRPNSEDDAEAFEEMYKKAKKRVREISQDISCALTGKSK